MSIETFDVKYIRAHRKSVEFKTDIGGPYTAHEQRNALIENPFRGWVLDFEKTPEAYADVEAFFIRCKGKWKSFYWQYKSHDDRGRYIGGDDTTYLVRFDTDKLDISVSGMGYKTFSLPITEIRDPIMKADGQVLP